MCRAFKKRSTGQTKHAEGWEANLFYDDTNRVSPAIEANDYITSQPPSSIFSQSFMCKQELEAAENLNFAFCDQFIQLPQLESPSLPTIKRPSSVSLASSSENDDLEDELPRGRNISNNNGDDNNVRYSNNTNKVTDWRALDKFVASQLSQEDQYGLGEGLSSNFGEKENSDLAYMFMEGARQDEDGEGAEKLNAWVLEFNKSRSL